MAKAYILPLFLILYIGPFQSVHSFDGRFYFRNFNVEDGLSHQTVYAILQDRQGFMWFGTKDGLNRFDGNQFKVFKQDRSQPNALGSSTVLSLYEDEQHHIWIGTNDGVYVYDPEKESFSAFPSANEAVKVKGSILEIRQDNSGNIWMASNTEGLYKYHIHSKKLTNYRHNQHVVGTLAHGSVSSLTIDRQGTVWVGILGSGVQKFIAATESFIEYKDEREILKKNLILHLFDHGQELLIGTKSGGLKRLNKATGQIEDILTQDEKHNPLFIRNINKDLHNQIWICTERGLYLYDPLSGKYQHIQQNPNDPYSLSDNATYTSYQDREGGIWVGTYFGGINYLPNQTMQFDKYYPISGSNAISGRRVREMVEDHEGNIWIGTEDAGLNRFNPISKTFLSIPSGKGKNDINYHNIHGLVRDGNKLWVSSHSMNFKIDVLGLPELSITKLNPTDLHNPLYDSDIFSLYKDSKGLIWIGTISGIYKADPITYKFQKVESLGIPFTYDIIEDQEGWMWFATTNNGLYKYNPTTGESVNYRHQINDPNSLPDHAIICLSLDHQGKLWIGTEGGGLAAFDPQIDGFSILTTSGGLPSNVVYKILEDDLHHLWLSTSNGLVQYQPLNGHIKVFHKSTGLLTDQFNYKSGLKAKDGRLYFGTLQGFISFDPKTFTENPFIPPVVMTGIKVFNREVEIGKASSPLKKSVTNTEKITLKHDENSIGFSFAALGFTAMDSWSYTYILEGFDKEWHTLDKNQAVTYSNLPPGQYVFKVKTTQESDQIATAATSLEVTITPPFYLTYVAFLLYFLLSIGLIYILITMYKNRVSARHKEKLFQLETEKEREIYHAKVEFFTNITHEIRTPLTLIKGPLEEIIKKKEAFSEDIQENLLIMDRNSTRLINLSNQLLDFRKTEQRNFSLNYIKTDMVTLLKDLHFRFKATAIQKKINFGFHVEEHKFYADVDREAFTKILSNLLSNAFKNAQKVIDINFKPLANQWMEITVYNDGKSIDPDQSEKIFEPFYQIHDTHNHTSKEGTGLGLPLARSLAELHRGKLILRQCPQHPGNSFVLSLPIKQEHSLALEDGTYLADIIENTSSLPTSTKSDTALENKASLLIAEDNKELLSFIANHLKYDFHIYKVENGQEALALLDEKPIDLIISDVMMPVINGYELCKEVKGKIEYSHIPVILLTAKQNLQSKIEGLEMGADVYIEKPFSIDYLTLQIKNLLHYRDQVRHSFANSPLVLAETIAHTQADELFLNKINLIILNQLSNELFGVSDLAEAVSMSQSSLLRKIKGISKLTPNEYIRLVRLKKAAEILNEGNHTITEVCSLVGFNSPSYFSKCFFKQFGELPKDYHKADPSHT
ncbi:hypothetical protein EL17_20645 [Anditalea andensis]|uniref:histidine kinase n=1 Tax=Anditalea andensis TaxID=1048983 RepID=A0A074KWD9_9BACT|nr:hypothetical protein EL17_20645 [Anditalea andensis]